MAEDTLAGLRSLMASHSPPLDALVVPSEDYHQVLVFLFLCIHLDFLLLIVHLICKSIVVHCPYSSIRVFITSILMIWIIYACLDNNLTLIVYGIGRIIGVAERVRICEGQTPSICIRFHWKCWFVSIYQIHNMFIFSFLNAAIPILIVSSDAIEWYDLLSDLSAKFNFSLFCGIEPFDLIYTCVHIYIYVYIWLSRVGVNNQFWECFSAFC